MTQLSQSRKCYLLVISDPVPYSQQLPTLLVALHHHCIHHWHFPFPMLSFLGVTMTYCPQSSHKVHYLAKIHAIHQVICHQIHSYSFSFTATSESLLILMS